MIGQILGYRCGGDLETRAATVLVPSDRSTRSLDNVGEARGDPVGVRALQMRFHALLVLNERDEPAQEDSYERTRDPPAAPGRAKVRHAYQALRTSIRHRLEHKLDRIGDERRRLSITFAPNAETMYDHLSALEHFRNRVGIERIALHDGEVGVGLEAADEGTNVMAAGE